MSKKGKSLTVQKGIEQPPSINPAAFARLQKHKKKLLSADAYFKGIREGNLNILGQAITLLESSSAMHSGLAKEVIEKCLPYSGNSYRIGITGVPGVGKSSFLEEFGQLLVDQGKNIAILAIDPSSDMTKGSILGDKTRMEKLSAYQNVFIRPSPSGGLLGGVTKKTRETIFLCEAAGFNVIFIETVGVGQSETAVHSMVDFFLLLMLARAGDDLQGIKRGIIEMADSIVITKVDGNNIPAAHKARTDFKNALHLFPQKLSGWVPKVLACSAVEKTGMDEIFNMLNQYFDLVKTNGFFEQNRKKQARYWLHETIRDQLLADFYQNESVKTQIENIENQVIAGTKSSLFAAGELLALYQKKR